MGVIYATLTVCKLELRDNENIKNTSIRANFPNGGYLNLILNNNHPQYSLYMSYVKDNVYVRGKYEVKSYTNHRHRGIISELYKCSLKFSTRFYDIIPHSDGNYNIIFGPDSNEYYCPITLFRSNNIYIFPESVWYIIEYDYDIHGRKIIKSINFDDKHGDHGTILDKLSINNIDLIELN
jgi:hypothetical protein